MNSQCQIEIRRVRVDPARGDPGELGNDIAAELEAPFIGQAQDASQLIPAGKGIGRLGVHHDFAGSRTNIRRAVRGDRHAGYEQKDQKAIQQATTDHAAASKRDGAMLDTFLGIHGAFSSFWSACCAVTHKTAHLATDAY